MLFTDVGKPILPPVGVVILRRDTWWSIPVGALPPGDLAEAGVIRFQPFMEWYSANTASGLELAIWPVHGVEQAQTFLDALREVALVYLKALEAGNVNFGEIKSRTAGDNPFGDCLAGASGTQDAAGIEACGDEETLH